MGKKKAVKLGINLGQYPNGGGGTCPNLQINKVPGRLPFKNKTMYALWVKIKKFNHCHAFIIQSLAFLIKPDFRTSCKLELFSKTYLGRFQNIHIFLAVFSFQCVDWVFKMLSV